MSKAIPNTTQVPNVILDEWMPKLKDTELRVLLVVVRQTIGWIEDEETGRRKEKDWISVHQFEDKTGCERWAIGKALTALIKMGLIEALSEDGNILETPRERQGIGSKIFYRLKTRSQSLFDELSPIQKGCGKIPKVAYNGFQAKVRENPAGVREKEPPGISPITKETLITKDILATETSVAGDNSEKSSEVSEKQISNHSTKQKDLITPQKETPTQTIDRLWITQKSSKFSGETNAEEPKEEGEQEGKKASKTSKPPSDHKLFVDFWYENVKAARRLEKPIITGQDGKNLQRVLKIIGAQTLEQLGVYFLNHPSFKGFSPSVSTFLSSGVLNGLQNRMANDPNFWHDLSSYRVAGANPKGRDAPNPQRIREELEKLKAALAQKLASPYKTMAA